MAITNLMRSLIFSYFIVVLLFTTGCTDSSPHLGAAPSAPLPTISSNNTVERVEVYHFHGNRQCSSCIAVGDLAEQTVETRFRDEVAFGRLVFAHVNVELPENYDLAAKYGVSGSSLWIGVYDGSGFHKKEDVRVWSLIGNKDAYTEYLSGVLTRRLNGDLT